MAFGCFLDVASMMQVFFGPKRHIIIDEMYAAFQQVSHFI